MHSSATRPAWFRIVAWFLSLQCLWMFALATPVQAMGRLRPNGKNPAPAKAIPSRFIMHPQPPQGKVRPPTPSLSLLDNNAHPKRTVTILEAQGWRTQLRQGRLAPNEAAKRHLWLGEWELVFHDAPKQAQPHFQAAQQLTPASPALHGLARYDSAMTLYAQGAYAKAVTAFDSLLTSTPKETGFDVGACALALRHASACAGYHALHAKLGIVEPTQRDPLDGPTALAACLRQLGLRSDRSWILQHCYHTGIGTQFANLIAAGKRLGASAYPVHLDEAGLKALSVPLIAFVEHDHFIAVTGVDNTGVTYLCSDCGAWPGGQLHLTWKQWRAMECRTYVAITLPGSVADKALLQLAQNPNGVQLAAGGLGSLYLGKLGQVATLLAQLRNHANLLKANLISEHCAGWWYCYGECPCYQCCPEFDPFGLGGGSGGGGSGGTGGRENGPQGHDPVNLATGEESYTPDPDLTVHNPNGPGVVWQLRYDSYRAANQAPFAGTGWSHGYNTNVSVLLTDQYYLTLTLENGAVVTYSATSAPAAGQSALCTAPAPGIPLFLQWNSDATSHWSFTLIRKDRSQMTFQQKVANGPYVLTQITNAVGRYITLLYDANGNLSQIKNQDNSKTLLTLFRPSTNNPSQLVSYVYDCYGRYVYYNYDTNNELNQISQVTPLSATPPMRYMFVYNTNTTVTNLLVSITVPAMGNSPQSAYTALIGYNTNTHYVTSLQDANGNTTQFNYAPQGVSNATQATQYASTQQGGGAVYTYLASYTGSLSNAGATDGAGNVLSYRTYTDPNDPYTPDTVQDGNQYKNHPGDTSYMTSYVHDAYGNVLHMQTARGIWVDYTYAYPTQDPTAPFFGQLVQIQESYLNATGTQRIYKQPMAVAYYANGRVHTVQSPLPDTTTAHNAATVTTTYTYTATLWQPLTIQEPGAATGTTITTSYNYGTTEQMGEPTSVTVGNSGGVHETVQYTYADATTPVNTGMVSGVTDAQSNITQYTYNLANQPLTVIEPASGQGAGTYQVTTTNTYWYTGGPVSDTSIKDEYNTSIRETTPTYGLEGELLGVSGSTEPVTYVYDPLYRRTTLTDGKNNSTHYYYNARGYLDAVILPGYGGPTPTLNANGCYGTIVGKDSVRFQTGTGSAATPGYDYNGNITHRFDGNGTGNAGYPTTFVYNTPDSLFTNVQYNDLVNNVNNVTLTYDGDARPLTRTDAAGQYGWTYDDLDLVQVDSTTYTNLPTWTQTYTHFPDGSRTSLALANNGVATGSFTYDYDVIGRPKDVINPAGQKFAWTYQANGWLQTQTATTSAATLYTATYGYNHRGLLTDLQYANVGGTLSEFGNATPTNANALQYDGAGSRTHLHANFGAVTGNYTGDTNYAYDGGATNAAGMRGQLTSESSTRNSGSNTFAYDTAGNPTTFRSSNPTYNANNQTVGNTYDGNGNPTTYSGLPCVYDPENRLTSITTATTALTAGYRADGLRAWKSAAAVANNNAIHQNGATQGATQAQVPKTYFLYDGDDPVAELDAYGNLTATNTWGATGLLARQSGTSGPSSVYTFDPSGNVAQRLDGSGTLKGSYAFDSFGKRITNDTAPDPYQYGGQWGYYTDSETGLTLCGHRYYDSGTGRWLNRDPIGYEGGINLYGYVGNNAANEIDPSGLLLIISPSFSKSDISKLKAAIKQMRKTKRGKKILDHVEKCSVTYEIVPNPLRNDQGLEWPVIDGFSTIEINPDKPHIIDTTKGKMKQSLARLLAHELGHACGNKDDGPNNLNNIHRNENPVAEGLGEPDRTTYR